MLIVTLIALGIIGAGDPPDTIEVQTPTRRNVNITDVKDLSAAPVYAQSLDPSDFLDFTLTLTKEGVGSPGNQPLLQNDEDVADWSVNVTPEAGELGLIIADSAPFAPMRDGLVVQVWLSVDPAKRGLANYKAAGGAKLGVEFNLETTKERRKQRTAFVMGAHQ